MTEPVVTPEGHPLLPLLLADSVAASRGDYPLDRIRLQKALFLVSMRGPARWAGTYDYKPYDWGPYCRDVTRDMAGLVRAGLVRVEPFPGSTHGQYVTTRSGRRESERARAAVDGTEARFLDEVRRYVTGLSFNALLREVYSEYPDYAVNSKFSG